MQKLLRHDVTPPEPAFYSFRHPETGFISVAQDWWTWQENIRAHRKGNNLPIPDNMIQIAEEQLCSVLPAGWCSDFDPDRTEPLTRMHWGDILAGMKVFAKWFAEGKPYVDQEEANRRAQICSTCPMNVHVQGCGACHDMAALIAGKVSTPYDNSLQACGVCKCLTKAKVHFPLSILETTDTERKQLDYPGHCWLKKGGANYEVNGKT